MNISVKSTTALQFWPKKKKNKNCFLKYMYMFDFLHECLQPILLYETVNCSVSLKKECSRTDTYKVFNRNCITYDTKISL